MFAGSLVLAVTLLAFAAWLHINDTRGWPQESYGSELDDQYLRRRRRSRRRIHVIIAFCGVMIGVAAVAGPGPVWVAAWLCVTVAMLTVVLLAALDAWRTHRYQRRKLPEIRRDLLGEDDR